MKRILLLGIMATGSLFAIAQTEDLGGVTIVQETYAQKISRNGEWVVGYSVDGGTVLYNTETGKATFYGTGDYGRGYVVSDQGWVVGCELRDNESNLPVVMKDGVITVPSVFNKNNNGNIHSITPDGSRVCGVVGGATYDNLPFYCDVDANGEFGPIQFLPFPDKDFFDMRPMYCSATWISSDGKVIAGQVKDSHGFFLYPILYIEGEDGSWDYSLPSQSLFNMNKLEVPKPIADMEEMFPDAPYPDIQKFMTAEQYKDFVADGEPWGEINKYMDENKILEYEDALETYWDAQEKYNELYEDYMAQYWRIVDDSVLFVQNAMALSADGKWLASSAKKEVVLNAYDVVEFYVPYLCNLETGEWVQAGPNNQRFHTNQVLPGGVMVCNSIGSDVTPANTYLYLWSSKEFVSLTDYIKSDNPEYYEWLNKYIVGDLITGEDANGNLIFETNVPFTGQAAISEDGTVIVGGVPAYIMDYNMTYFSYVFKDVVAGVEDLAADVNYDGVYTVFNLQGVKVLVTKNLEELRNLPKGLYVINGKKFAL